MPTIEDLGQQVKAKYPGVYDDLPNADLGLRIQKKFPGAYDDFRANPALGKIERNMSVDVGDALPKSKLDETNGGFPESATPAKPIIPVERALEVGSEPGVGPKLQAASMIGRGAAAAVSPIAAPAAAIASPVAVPGAVAGGTLAGTAAHNALEGTDLHQGYKDTIEDVAGLAGGALGAKGLGEIASHLGGLVDLAQKASGNPTLRDAIGIISPRLKNVMSMVSRGANLYQALKGAGISSEELDAASTLAKHAEGPMGGPTPASTAKEPPVPEAPNPETSDFFSRTNGTYQPKTETKPSPAQQILSAMNPEDEANRAALRAKDVADQDARTQSRKADDVNATYVPRDPLVEARRFIQSADPNEPLSVSQIQRNFRLGYGAAKDLLNKNRPGWNAKATDTEELPTKTDADVKIATPPGVRTPGLADKGGLTPNEIANRAAKVSSEGPAVMGALKASGMDISDLQDPTVRTAIKQVTKKVTGRAWSDDTIDAFEAKFAPKGTPVPPVRKGPAATEPEDYSDLLAASIEKLAAAKKGPK